MPRKNLSVQEALAIFEELPSDDDSVASNKSDTDDEDYVENVVQEEQCPSTSQPEVKWGKLYKKIDLLQNSRKHIPVKTEGGLYRRCSLSSTRKGVHRSRWLCRSCNVPLFLQAKGPTCFEKFHSEELIKCVK
ncbi:hypothetical protein TNIN_376051 [Trichonephila inaurata madagascariensis]|uniref:Uncharacterized protein n=1 Tax=Trichonephila inaurata madagascariensis TaxID=2747483 RepID=A0A8X6XEU2_9ARAC|nr:hypothetical protein TNIN_376051 [Trichonephila inaurata madagascariensis]